MTDRHTTEKLSAYLNRELPKAERQAIAEHLLRCEKCREEHDRIKLGAALASRLESRDAPENLWREIENRLNNAEKPQKSLSPRFSLFASPGLTAAGGRFFIFIGLAAAVYLGLPKIHSPESVKIETQKLEKNGSANRDLPFWNVETIAGTTAGGETALQKGKLAVSEFLETDAGSRARVSVADIGQIEIAPNSRVQLVNTGAKEHRLSLTKGILQARIFAPPRLFIVETPSATAVDLGCEYTLEVDAAGNSKLHVTSGFVALERDGRESIVPAGAKCLTRKGAELGTPFFAGVSDKFQTALEQFDFANGGEEALKVIFSQARANDTLTLWHLLPKTQGKQREKVFRALVSFVKLPPEATRDGVLRLDEKMLELWRAEIEKSWFE